MKKIIAGLCFFMTGLLVQPAYSLDVKGGPRPNGLFDVYEHNRKQGTANYITVDFLLLSYSMLRKQDIHLLEQGTVMPAFTDLISGLAKDLGKKKDPVSLANRDFMAVLQALLSGKDKVSNAGDLKKAQEELKLVKEGKGVELSPLWGYSMDFSQFKPRGFYTESPGQSRYFQAMRYASQVLFVVKESKATGIDAALADRLTAQALQLAGLIKRNKGLSEKYATIVDQLAFRMGPADDLLLADLLTIDADNKKINKARKKLFDFAGKNGRKPRVLANLVDRNKLEAGVTAEDVLTGWRLFPQRYTPDSAFFQALVDPESGKFVGGGTPFGLTAINGKPGKGFVSSYELMASLGSKAAGKWLDAHGERGFSGYKHVTGNGRKELSGASGLDALHMAMLSDLYASSKSEDSSRLTTGLAFWTWQRYVTLLYTKQSMTMIGKSLSMDPKRKGGVIELASAIYNDLFLISSAYAAHSAPKIAALWQDFSTILKRCSALSSKGMLHFPLTVEDGDYLNNLDAELKVLTGGKDHPIVVDIHTEPNSRKVVENATGLPVLVWQDKARGARLSHYEFKQPMKNRLTDGQWQEMLRKGETPKWK